MNPLLLLPFSHLLAKAKMPVHPFHVGIVSVNTLTISTRVRRPADIPLTRARFLKQISLIS